jgi:hypothetical protein
MEILKLKNTAGLELTVTTHHPDDYQVISGGLTPTPASWEEYADIFTKAFRPKLELIKDAIVNIGWVGHTAERHANHWCFVFSDGSSYGFSWRAWGDMMSAIVGKAEGYMKYYM